LRPAQGGSAGGRDKKDPRDDAEVCGRIAAKQDSNHGSADMANCGEFARLKGDNAMRQAMGGSLFYTPMEWAHSKPDMKGWLIR